MTDRADVAVNEGVPEREDLQLALTIVITTYNRPDTLRECLHSIANQESIHLLSEHVEVVVTRDFHSTSMSEEIDAIVASFAEAVPGLSVHLSDNPRKRGQSSNTNNGILQARGRYFQVLHDDDALHPCFFEVMVPVLLNAEEALVVVDPQPWRGESTFVARFGPSVSTALIDPRYLASNFLVHGTFVPSISMIRNDLSRDLFFDETLNFVCDWEIFGRLLMTSHLRRTFIRHVRAGLVLYRAHEEGLSGSEAGALTHLSEHLVLVRKFIFEHGLFQVLAFTDSEVERFLADSTAYRRGRLEHDLASIKIKRILSRAFRKSFDAAMERQREANPLLTADWPVIATTYRSWVRHIIRRRASIRARRILSRKVIR